RRAPQQPGLWLLLGQPAVHGLAREGSSGAGSGFRHLLRRNRAFAVTSFAAPGAPVDQHRLLRLAERKNDQQLVLKRKVDPPGVGAEAGLLNAELVADAGKVEGEGTVRGGDRLGRDTRFERGGVDVGSGDAGALRVADLPAQALD